MYNVLEQLVYLISPDLSFTCIRQQNQMSLVTRKPVFGVFEQVRLKLASSATETS